MLSPDDVLYLWFEGQFSPETSLQDKAHQWFDVNRRVDRYLRRRLIAYTTLASEDALATWQNSAESCLALVLLLDRITRACYRGSSLSFANDKKARIMALSALDKGFDWRLNNPQRMFLIFPLIASEKPQHQLIAREKLEIYVSGADSNEITILENLIALIDRNTLLLNKFSRFPHRAKLQGRGLKDTEKDFVVTTPWQHWL